MLGVEEVRGGSANVIVYQLLQHGLEDRALISATCQAAEYEGFNIRSGKVVKVFTEIVALASCSRERMEIRFSDAASLHFGIAP